MNEMIFEFDRDQDCQKSSPLYCGWHIVEWLNRCAKRGKAYRVTVRMEQVPARVPWPEWAEGVTRMRIGVVGAPGRRPAFLLGKQGVFIGAVDQDELGVWPPSESRIAENDNGYVKLIEVENAKR